MCIRWIITGYYCLCFSDLLRVRLFSKSLLGLSTCNALSELQVRLVFEAFESSSQGRALAGGGRYDNLIQKLGGPQMAAVGFAMGDVTWDASVQASSLKDGEYQVAIRPHHILPMKTDKANIAITGQVGVTELSGSESSAHFVFGDHAWVSLSHGVHPYQVGEDHTFYMNPSECLYFAPDGSRAA